VTPFPQAYGRAKDQIERAYGIPVTVTDVPAPNTGDFNGLRILVDYDQEADSALFVLVHLFGHTVQWATSERYRQVGTDLSIGKGDQELAQIFEYEQTATRYGARVLHDAGVRDLDQWLTDWWYADWQYLAHYYRTGERLDCRALFRPNAHATLEEMTIPSFVPFEWGSRWSF